MDMFTYKLVGQKAPVNLIDRNVCGSETREEITYDVEANAHSLDANGFVFDAVTAVDDIASAWSGRRPFKASCEELAAGIAGVIKGHMGRRALAIKATVFSAKGFASYEWADGVEEFANGPRKAKDSDSQPTPTKRPC